MKEIDLTQGYVTVVDDDVYPEVIKYFWYADVPRKGNIYAKNSQVGKLHRYIMERVLGQNIQDLVIDHKDGNTLNNCVENLRVVRNKRENSRNQIARKNSQHSKYTGVTFREHAKRWCSKIKVDKKHVFLGYYDTAEEAGMAYDRAVLYYFPEESTVLNFPDRKHEHDLSAPYTKQYKKTKSTNTSGYRGVFVVKKKNSEAFSASINVGGREGKKVYLGTFDNAEYAAYSYDVARLVLDRIAQQETPKEYLNFPDVHHSGDELADMTEFLYNKNVL